MKFLALTLLLIFGFSLISCSEANVPADVLAPNSPKQILEVTSDFSGFYWMNGQVLDFRLYDDGIAEYDEYPLQSPDRYALKAETVKQTKQVKIDEEDFQRILDLLESSEFSKTESRYLPLKSCLDAFINTKINSNIGNNNRQIFIKDHCLNLEYATRTTDFFKSFPVTLNELFQKINKIKNKESAGKFYY